MLNSEFLRKLYDLGRANGMTHREALDHASRLHVDVKHWIDNIDVLYTSAYIAAREDYPEHTAKVLAQNYVDGYQELARQA